ncbi:ABC transporter permease subunit [Pusillimonas sp.]|uniref:amino acid ABC transporter permease n=1 Tax=Pusillimonas sp. TaxID=3040095 RepID=UPI0029B20A1A|nr:ABC transporter permease subunit [Pusillimonas sp.]MDX3893754.1 ABC transporter permease subunit [Pusillimonas sp.]
MKSKASLTPSRHPARPAGGLRLRPLLYQALLLAAVGLVAWYLVANTLANLQARNISTGFGFLKDEAGFAIGESMLPYTPTDSYGRALWIGVLNTLRVAALGIIASTVLGVLLGIARLSRNWLVSGTVGAYIETMRNIPLLLHLFFWYALITESMPGPRQALNPLPGVFLSNRGLAVPWFEGSGAQLPAWAALAALAACIVFLLCSERGRALRMRRPLVAWTPAFLLLALSLAAWFSGNGSPQWQTPQLKGFNFQGGATLSPEFAALLIGLVLYTSAFVAEVVRSGIQAIGRGQRDAARALGLAPGQVLRLVVLPQALRVIVPPMTSQYLNLTKNSSLAVAIGYPDIVSIANTTLNQTGQAIEGVLIIMAAYLTVSLTISVLMNWYNRRIALVER